MRNLLPGMEWGVHAVGGHVGPVGVWMSRSHGHCDVREAYAYIKHDGHDRTDQYVVLGGACSG
jgi:hypothetical protein